VVRAQAGGRAGEPTSGLMVKSSYNLPGSHVDDEPAIRHWLDGLASHYSAEELERISGACAELTRCRGDRRIETGETHVRHVLSTADILAENLNGLEWWDAATGIVWFIGIAGSSVALGLALIWLRHLRVLGWLLVTAGPLLGHCGAGSHQPSGRLPDPVPAGGL